MPMPPHEGGFLQTTRNGAAARPRFASPLGRFSRRVPKRPRRIEALPCFSEVAPAASGRVSVASELSETGAWLIHHSFSVDRSTSPMGIAGNPRLTRRKFAAYLGHRVLHGTRRHVVPSLVSGSPLRGKRDSCSPLVPPRAVPNAIHAPATARVDSCVSANSSTSPRRTSRLSRSTALALALTRPRFCSTLEGGACAEAEACGQGRASHP